MLLVAIAAGCSKAGTGKTSVTVLLGPGGGYYLENCAYDAFRRQGGTNDYGIFGMKRGPMGAADLPTQGAALSGNFEGFGARTLWDDTWHHTPFTANVVFHAATRDETLARMRQLKCFEFHG